MIFLLRRRGVISLSIYGEIKIITLDHSSILERMEMNNSGFGV